MSRKPFVSEFGAVVALFALLCASPGVRPTPAAPAAAAVVAPARVGTVAAVAPPAPTPQPALPPQRPAAPRADTQTAEPPTFDQPAQSPRRGRPAGGAGGDSRPNRPAANQPPPSEPPPSEPLAEPPPADPPPATPELPDDAFPRGRYHLVQSGDTAAELTARHGLRDEWRLYDANPALVGLESLPAGLWLYLPHPTATIERRPRPGEPGWSSRPGDVALVDQVWLDLAQCESSGDWGIDTGNGYYGGLQFKLSSWQAVGGSGRPNEALPIEQIARADALQRIQGWRAWPACSLELGLR